MKLSIVTTLYQSEKYIAEFHHRTTAAARQNAGDDYEIIFVNDGSPDNSLELAVQFSQGDRHVTVVDLSRNFGHHKAIMTGLSYAQGDHVFLLDSDLEEEPEWLHTFSDQLQKKDCDVVFGVQVQRRGSLLEIISGKIFYSIFRHLTGVQQPNNIVTARLMTRRYVSALLEHKEREVNIGALWVITGFTQSSTIVNKHSTSPTTYSFIRKFSHLVNAITSFSSLPLVLIFYTGLIMSLISGFYVLYLVVNYFLFSTPMDGYTSIISSIWLLAGLIILFIGIQGIYISKIFSEVKQRPYTIIKQVYK